MFIQKKALKAVCFPAIWRTYIHISSHNTHCTVLTSGILKINIILREWQLLFFAVEIDGWGVWFLVPLTALSLADAFHDSFQMFCRASFLNSCLASDLGLIRSVVGFEKIGTKVERCEKDTLKNTMWVRFKGLCKEKRRGCSDPHPALDALIRSRHWAFSEEDVCADKSTRWLKNEQTFPFVTTQTGRKNRRSRNALHELRPLKS